METSIYLSLRYTFIFVSFDDSLLVLWFFLRRILLFMLITKYFLFPSWQPRSSQHAFSLTLLSWTCVDIFSTYVKYGKHGVKHYTLHSSFLKLFTVSGVNHIFIFSNKFSLWGKKNPTFSKSMFYRFTGHLRSLRSLTAPPSYGNRLN